MPLVSNHFIKTFRKIDEPKNRPRYQNLKNLIFPNYNQLNQFRCIRVRIIVYNGKLTSNLIPTFLISKFLRFVNVLENSTFQHHSLYYLFRS